MKRPLLWVPLGLFLLFVALVAVRLGSGKDDTVRSQMVGKPVPALALAPMYEGRGSITPDAFRAGKPVMLNIFGSWCAPCKAEMPQLLALEEAGVIIDGVAVKDTQMANSAFLREYGDPFRNIGSDPASQYQFALGSSGVPETFIVDRQGIIRYQHIGFIGEQDLPELIAAYEAAR